MTQTADALVSRSQSHNEIVHADYTYDLDEALRLGCDDYADGTNGTREYWGENAAGTWRVHLDEPAADRAPGDAAASAIDYTDPEYLAWEKRDEEHQDRTPTGIR
jgi:hypothetical protein